MQGYRSSDFADGCKGVRHAVRGSSHVEWVEWDPASRTLAVSYKGGRVYRYAGVPYETWVGLQKAASKGSFLRREIQPNFAGEAGER